MSCSGTRSRIKPNPDPENFIICRICKGTGIIEVESGVSSRDDSDLNRDDFFSHLFIPEHDAVQQFEMNTDRDMNRPGRSSGFKHLIKCVRCEGVGWISRFEDTGSSISGSNELDNIIRANELLDKQN